MVIFLGEKRVDPKKSFAIIQNRTLPFDNPIRVRVLSDYWSRFRGLMLYPNIPYGDGVLIVEPREGRFETAIHMFFMRFAIAAVWIDAAMKVADVRLARPWRSVYVPERPAMMVLETRPDYLGRFRVGDDVQIRFE